MLSCHSISFSDLISFLFIFVSLLQDSDDIYANTYIPGTLTKHKFETLGTSDAVKESRQNYLTNQKKEKGKYACEFQITFSITSHVRKKLKFIFHFYSS